MKKLRILAALAAVLAISALVASCSFSSKISNDECIANFMSALNGSDRSTVYTNLDSASSLYTAAKLALYWNTFFPVGETYTLSGKSTSGSTVTGTFSSTTTYTATFGNITDMVWTMAFTMSTDSSGNAVIHKIDLAGGNASGTNASTHIFY
jgi:hypothetical protein